LNQNTLLGRSKSSNPLLAPLGAAEWATKG